MKKITLLLVLLFFAFSTQSNAQITTYPYSEDFEAGDGGWIADNTTAGTWALGVPAGTVINSADSGANAWVTNLTGDYNTNEDSWVQSPVFDLSTLSAPSFQFSIWWNSENSWDGMVLQSSIDSGTSWQNVGAFGDANNWYTDNTINGNPGGQQEGWTGRESSNNGSQGWVTARNALTGLAGQSNVIFRFAFGSDGSVQDDGIAFDTISIFDVSCPEPSGLTATGITSTSADLAWTENGTAALWNIEIVPTGTAPTGTPTASGISNPYNASGLTAITTYDFYVQADCSGSVSSWAGPFTFTTLCDVFTPDYFQDFSTIIPNCWDEADNGDATTGPTDLGAGSWLADGFLNDGFTGAYKINLWLAAKSDWIISPQFDLTGGPFQVEFDFGIMQFGSSTTAGTLGSDDIVQLLITTDNGTTWTPLLTWDNTSVVPVTGEHPVVDLTAYAGQTVQFGILGSEGIVDDTSDNDVFVDNFQVRNIPLCQDPTGINVTNITGTTADINWNANGETAWEYVVSLAGTGAPVGAGNPITITTVNETGLSFSTDYEFWVRSDCGGVFGTWIGPITFTTTVQTDFSVDCTLGPINSFLCYGNNDSELFTYTSSDGSPLNLTINSGEIEGAPFDFLVILDSDGVTELYNGEGNDGVLDGLTFQSTGDTIFLQIASDGSVSCESGSFCCSSGIDYTVACATCINPTATYQVVDDCASGDQFLIDVDVTSLGDATSVSISDNQGSAPVSVSVTGITQFGPYPFLIDVIITISNEQDVNCVINSAPIQLLACPPDNDNCDGATVVIVNDDGSCDLITPGTVLAATPSGVPVGSCGGDPDDDVWFQFTALSEVQLISLINVVGGFNLDHGLYEGGCGSLTELYCSDGDASVTPQLTIGNTYYVRVFSGGSADEITTFDLCIREAPTNIICDNAENFCSDGGALTSPNIIGIPDTGQIACLFTAPNPTWNIIQIGDPGLIEIEINQTDAGGGGLDVDFVLWGPFASLTDACGNLDIGCPTPGDCPNNTTNPNFYPSGNIIDCSYSAAPIENLTIDNALSGEIYILLVTNFSNNPGNVTITQTNGGGGTGNGTVTAEIEAEITSNEVVFVDDDSDPGTPEVAAVCGFDSVTIIADSPFADSYVWYADGFVIPGETSATLTVTESNTYQVQAFDEQCDTDAFSQIVVVKLYKDPGAIGNLNLTVCDGIEADGVADFDLDALAATIGLSADFVVSYYATEADANQAINALASPYNTAGETIHFRIEDVEAANDGFLGCRQLTEVTLLVNPIPTANQPQDLLECNNNGSFDFDLTSQDVDINSDGGDIVITYYASQNDADNGTNALSSPYNSAGQTIYVRVEDTTTGCFNTTSFNVVLDIVPLASFNNSVVDYEVCPNATTPILISLLPSNFTESEVTVEWFLDGGLISGENGLTLPVLVEGDYTAVITFNTTLCFNTITETVTELESCVIPQGISPGEVDDKNDTFDLSSYNVTKLEIFNRNGTLVYSKTNYTDEWRGQSDAGDELPVGTYFYTMIYEGGAKKRSAWIYINR